MLLTYYLLLITEILHALQKYLIDKCREINFDAVKVKYDSFCPIPLGGL